MSTAKSLASMLKQNDDRLADLYRHCRLLQNIDNIVCQCLPDDLASHCQVVNFSNSRLVLQTDSPAWNTLLRYQTPDLMSQLRQHPPLRGLASIHIKTMPAIPAPPHIQAAHPRHLSPDTAALIRSLATTVGDPRLQAALQRLASRNKPD